MEMHDLLKKISELSTLTESKKETTHKGGTKSTDAGVTKHKGKYGTEYQGDDDEENQDDDEKAKKAKAAAAPKRGRGRPKKGADSSTGEVAKYQNAASLQSFMVGNLPKDKKGKPALPGKASKKHSLKEWFDEIDAKKLNETGMMAGGTGQPIMTQLAGKPAAILLDPSKIPAKDKESANLAAQTLAKLSKSTPGSVVADQPQSTGSSTTSNTQTAQTGMQSEDAMDESSKNKKWIKGAIKKPGAFKKKAAAHGKSTGEFASDVLAHKEKYPAKTEKQAVLAKTLGKLGKGKKSESVEEADVPSRDATASPLTNTPHMDKPKKKSKAKKGGWNNSLHEGSDSCRAAYHEGKCHAFENGHYRCRYDEGMDERSHYHRGFMEGLDECYGGSMMGEGLGTPAKMIGQSEINRMNGIPQRVSPEPEVSAKDMTRAVPGGGLPMRGDQFSSPLSRAADWIRKKTTPPNRALDEEQFQEELDALDEEMQGMEEGWNEGYDASLDEMDHSEWIDKEKAEAKRAGKKTATAFGQKFPVEEESMNNLDVTMESWNKQLQQLLNEDSKPVAEGVTVSTSSGQPHSPDSVSISATDQDAHRLLQMLSNAGIGLGHAMGDKSPTDATDDYSSEIGSRGDGIGGNQSFSRNVDDVECEVVPYDYQEVSGALGSGGQELSQLRKRLLALESKMEMPDGMGFSKQSEEEEPDDTPEATEPYDFEEVQGALEKGGDRAAKPKKEKEKVDESEIMAMPDGKGFSKPGEAKEKMQDGPTEMPVDDLDSVLGDLEQKDTHMQDEYEKAFSKLKSMIMSQVGGESKPKSEPKSDTSASSTSSDDSSEEDHSSESDDGEEELKEGSDRCDECGAMYEGSHEDHVCEETTQKLDEWANTPGHTHPSDEWGNETVTAEEEYMINTISGGLNKQKVQRPHGYRQTDNPLAMSVNQDTPRDPLADWLKLSGVR